MKPTTTIESITDEQIEALRQGAGQAGDGAMVDTCSMALGDDEGATIEQVKRARERCVEAIRDAEAQR
jgi:hypothetical protein